MKFLAIDQHISIVSDLRNIFNRLGSIIDEYSLSGHVKIIGRTGASVPELNGENWVATVQDQQKRHEFAKKYRQIFDQYDGFIVGYPPIFALLYEEFNKPIIVDIAIRYEYGTHNCPGLWEYLNEFLMRDNVFLVANSLYDQKYTENFLNKRVTYIPSLCAYTGMTYNPVRGKFLNWGEKLAIFPDRIIHKSTLPFRHEWQEVGNYRGIFHVPYQTSIMSFFEQYYAGIPMFFPTKNLLMDFYKEGAVLSQISWNKLQKGESVSSLCSKCKHDPNNYNDLEAMSYWIDFSDFYNYDEFPYIKYYANEDDIQKYLDLPDYDLVSTSQNMRRNNYIRENVIIEQWSDLLAQVGDVL